MKKWLIEKLGGYATAEAAILTAGGYLTIEAALQDVTRMESKERYAILTAAVKRLFNTIDADDILKEGPAGEWLWDGKTLSRAQVEMLQAEAGQLTKMLLWKVLQRDVLYQANRKMFLQAENVEHVVTAKFWLYSFDTIRTRLKSLAKNSPAFNKKEN